MRTMRRCSSSSSSVPHKAAQMRHTDFTGTYVLTAAKPLPPSEFRAQRDAIRAWRRWRDEVTETARNAAAEIVSVGEIAPPDLNAVDLARGSPFDGGVDQIVVILLEAVVGGVIEAVVVVVVGRERDLADVGANAIVRTEAAREFGCVDGVLTRCVEVGFG